MNKFLLSVMVPVGLIFSFKPLPAKADINSAEIIQESLSFSCVAWRPTGVCFWLKCRPFPPSCSVETSIKVRHYNPDAIVQVYQTPGETPWDEMSFVSELVSLGQSGSTPANADRITAKDRSKDKGKDKRKQSSKIISRHVDIIGSPGLLPISEVLGSTDYGCESGVQPFQPYYVSTLDYFSWKFPYTEFLKLATFVPGMREVGERNDGQNETFLFTGRFGNVYPRIGSLMQNDTYKASAVFAQRAADIATDTSALHVYNFLGEKNSKDGWWPPGQVKEWTSKEGKWQMLYPRAESQCHIFGEDSTRKDQTIDTDMPNMTEYVYDGYQHRRSDDGNYAWQLWRPYTCCEKKGQVFLFSIDTDSTGR
ncbi:TIGR03756 family integrating conjugative element protein [Pseudoalteromonas sp. CST5]|uniref:TIGR03756 family integrating conjugative element protein n=1 Tax=unclassified Pseudoalteromonas TaxID=194690 RepID=UPI00235A1A9D|nr:MULTISPECIES: TIGR03756 family integrating conjugative element protein [unclassified Pseudoalteromonas]MDC9514470.1 TIGR03756 family integrating conjugative element protein [Pseudoalteromonas sp. CST1]MDC9538916.1 TIGR03756 family integrating conjugative element protein [Pseudoalteromonas sp. CST3]MDC9543057.1 TIGR03756 family integrating conjugative element protein [Pseudoalteromonas sp. CST2]MDC9545875.1 TIGR03756 family integrating conjugative element protein [Pseudoalteromonas sp. CST4]